MSVNVNVSRFSRIVSVNVNVSRFSRIVSKNPTFTILENRDTLKMIAVIQRVSEASVKIDGIVKGQIQTGFLVLLSVTHTDIQEDLEWISKKIVGMRIFSDEEGKMNLDLISVNGNILLISQFTLHASSKKGNRPSFMEAAKSEIAIPLYEKMILQLERALGKTIQSGEFGADMKISLINDGPVTIILDSKNKI